MDTQTVTQYLQQTGDSSRVTNQIFYKMLDQMVDFSPAKTKERRIDPTDSRCENPRTPTQDIAALGIHRESSKVRYCGDFIEVFVTTSHFVTGKGMGPTDPHPRGEKEEGERKANIIARSAKRAEKQVRVLINTNRLDTMWTLTFAPDSDKNREIYRTSSKEQQSDIAWIKKAWRNFYLQVSKDCPGWKWLVIFELHNSHKTSEIKRGTWHLHFATDTRLEWDYVSKLWEWGIVRFDDFSKPKKGVRDEAVRNPGAYMSKYIGKYFDDSNFHVKRYSRSRNMQLPEITDLAEMLQRFPNLGGLQQVFATSRRIDHEEGYIYLHNITYKQRDSRIPTTTHTTQTTTV